MVKGFSGIEDGQHLGNLDCQVGRAIVTGALSQDGYEPQCSGVGVIDCIGECAGTEEEFKEFMDVIPKLPMWVEVINAKLKDFDFDVEKFRASFDFEKVRAKVTGVIINGLLKCTWWSNFIQESLEETRSRLSLSNPRREPGEIFAYDTVSG